MFGFRFAKFAPGAYVFRYYKGKLVDEGYGLSFRYFSPATNIVAVNTVSSDAHFMFSEVTLDFQEITIQGQLTYHISDPVKSSKMLNFSVSNTSLNYISDDPQKLSERLINLALMATKGVVKDLNLKHALAASAEIERAILSYLSNSEMVADLGVSILGVTIAAVRPNAETARALEAKTREHILKESDDAVYIRRNAAVEQERAIKENELNTKIALENKNREIREKQMHLEKLVQQNELQMKESELDFNIAFEEKNRRLVELRMDNYRKQADMKAYEISALLDAYAKADPTVIQILANSNMESGRLMALAFQGIADKAEKIGQLNITPDLLRTIVQEDYEVE